MSKKLILFLPLLSAAPLFLAGALRRPASEPAFSFEPQPIGLAPELTAASPDTLMNLAVDRLSPQRMPWLRVRLRQWMHSMETRFDAEGTLQLGPDHCARLDLAVHVGRMSSRSLVVSDGQAVAQVVQVGAAEPSITTRLLVEPAESAEGQVTKTPEQTLRELGCGGPYPLLKDLRTRLRALTAQTGLSEGRPVIRLHGRAYGPQTALGLTSAIAAEFCYLYFDAQSLWPNRLEWWGTDSKRVERLVLAMDFLDPQVNRPLSLEECVRVFSYRPEQ